MKENSIIEDAEQIFHETFSNGDYNSIEVPINNIVVPLKVCLLFQIYLLKTLKQNKKRFYVFSILLSQEINSDKEDEALNFILPGCLYPFKDDICRMFVSEKQKFLANKRFKAFFLTPH